MEFMVKIGDIFAEANETWQASVNEHGCIEDRPLEWERDLLPVFHEAQYRILPLYPDIWLPEGSKLTVYDDPSPGTQSRAAKHYYVSSNNALHFQDPNSPNSIHTTSAPNTAFRSFPCRHQRSQEIYNLNPLLVILNAHIECRRFMRDDFRPTLCDDDRGLVEKIMQLGEVIYFRPSIPPSQLSRKRSAPVADDDMDVDLQMPSLSELGVLPTNNGSQGGDGDKTLTPGRTKRQKPGLRRATSTHGESDASSITTVEEFLQHLESLKEEPSDEEKEGDDDNSPEGFDGPVDIGGLYTGNGWTPGAAVNIHHWRKGVPQMTRTLTT
ncbi:hypothetical protein CVT24_009757 [Panaeolus cyanescens]|uniref:Uncharacterized protein n=1 Tax=Panaeolus cyanescens TaxID=181874 RepID=A0A409WRU7_9AGAR|nr:hypothetical protein CVT24_009757 [Panaeolus cyanescens]